MFLHQREEREMLKLFSPFGAPAVAFTPRTPTLYAGSTVAPSQTGSSFPGR